MVEVVRIKSRSNRTSIQTRDIKITTTNIRIRPDVYRALAIRADEEKKSITSMANELLAKTLRVI